MMANERHKIILEQIRLYGRVKASDLADELGVSEITLRRDLNELHAEKALTRVHGGAVRVGSESPSVASQVLIGILIPGSAYYFPEVVKGMEAAAERHNVRLVLGVSGSQENEAAQVKRLLALGVEGVAITTVLGDARAAELGGWLDEIPVPVVLVERSFSFPHLGREVDYVRSDHSHGATQAVRHLHELGHRNIAAALSLTPTSYWLEKGFVQGLTDFGLPPESTVVHFPNQAQGVDLQAMDDFLDQVMTEGITGVFVHNDTHASAMVDAAQARGIRIPTDLSVIAYDDVVAKLAAVPLTAVSPPKHAVGALALEQLLRRIGYVRNAEATVMHLALLPTLSTRCSTAAPRHI